MSLLPLAMMAAKERRNGPKQEDTLMSSKVVQKAEKAPNSQELMELAIAVGAIGFGLYKGIKEIQERKEAERRREENRRLAGHVAGHAIKELPHILSLLAGGR